MSEEYSSEAEAVAANACVWPGCTRNALRADCGPGQWFTLTITVGRGPVQRQSYTNNICRRLCPRHGLMADAMMRALTP
jgi:hypothetical protein